MLLKGSNFNRARRRFNLRMGKRSFQGLTFQELDKSYYHKEEEGSVVWKYRGSASHQSKSPRPITWVTCHVIEARHLDAEPPIFPWQPSLLPWQQAPLPWQPRPEWVTMGEANMALPTPPSEGGGLKPIVLKPPSGGGKVSVLVSTIRICQTFLQVEPR